MVVLPVPDAPVSTTNGLIMDRSISHAGVRTDAERSSLDSSGSRANRNQRDYGRVADQPPTIGRGTSVLCALHGQMTLELTYSAHLITLAAN
jgi:hypothetical protein